MRIEKLRELERGQDVTVITKGDYQLVDVASGIKFPPLTEVKTPLTPFVENQLRLGNLTLADAEDAPKAKGKAVDSVDELRYEGSSATADASTRESRVEAKDDQNSSTGNEALTSTSTRRGRSAAADKPEE